MKDKGSLSDGDETSDEQHTPGPWTARESDVLDGKSRYQTDGAIMVYADGDCDLHPIADCSVNHTCRLASEAQANARLIAAAPDLLASLKEMRDVAAALFRVIDGAVECKADIIDDLHEEFEKAGIPNGFGVRANTAIAKARRSP